MRSRIPRLIAAVAFLFVGRIPRLIAAVAFLFVGLQLAVPPCFGSSPQKTDVQDVLDDLRGLEFDEFIDDSYKEILLRSPEIVTSMGLSQTLGIRDDQLDNICNDFVVETYELKAGISEILRGYERSQLSYEQQISYDSYSWILEGWAVEHEYMYHFYPVTHGFSRQNDLFRFFEDEHPLETHQNAEDYVSRLQQVDDQFRCLRACLEDSEARGILAPAQMLQVAADRIRWVVPGIATDLSFYTTLATKIEDIAELSAVQRQNLLIRAEQVINNSVIPAYQALVTQLDEQIPRAPAMNGVWQLPDGDGFYAARVRHHTTTELTAAEIHQKGLDEVERIRSQIWGHFATLGYPTNETYQQLFDRVAVDSGIVPAEEIVPLNESFIRQAQEDITEVFDIAPQTEVIVIGGSGGGFYVSGSLDGSRPPNRHRQRAGRASVHQGRRILYRLCRGLGPVCRVPGHGTRLVRERHIQRARSLAVGAAAGGPHGRRYRSACLPVEPPGSDRLLHRHCGRHHGAGHPADRPVPLLRRLLHRLQNRYVEDPRAPRARTR